MEEIVGFGGFFVLYYAVIWGIAIALYVLEALGLYTVAKRRGIDHAWLAWLPVGNMWLLGAIADSYRQVTRNEKKNRRTALLVLAIAVVVLVIVVIAMIIGSVFNLIMQAESSMYYDDTIIISQFLSIYFSAIGLFLLVGAVSIAQYVLQYICLYDLFSSCDPDNKVLYLLLSILFGLSAVFIFICRKKDLGMRPVQTATGYIPQQPMYRQPVYQQPVYQQPPYQQPVYQQPTQPMRPPVYQQPTQPMQPPVYQPPTQPMQPPVYQPPTQPMQPPVYQPPTQPVAPPPVPPTPDAGGTATIPDESVTL